MSASSATRAVPNNEQNLAIETISRKILGMEEDLARLKGQLLPIGTIAAWHKHAFPNNPLPHGWHECDGSVVIDPLSPLSGQNLPDLNSDGRFLRGSVLSGIFQDDAFQAHGHNFVSRASSAPAPGAHKTDGADHSGTSGYSHSGKVREAVSLTSADVVRVADETRPKNMSVVWIIRVL
jgi:hypothetical protein